MALETGKSAARDGKHGAASINTGSTFTDRLSTRMVAAGLASGCYSLIFIIKWYDRSNIMVLSPICDLIHIAALLTSAYCLRAIGERRLWGWSTHYNYKGTGMFDLTAFGDTFASHSWLWIPIFCAATISLLLWSGRIRQPAIVNFFAIGLILPCINLSMIATGALVAADQLTLDLMALMPF